MSLVNIKELISYHIALELGFTAPQHCIGYMAPLRKKLVGSTSYLHRDKTMGYGSNNLIPARDAQKLQINVIPC